MARVRARDAAGFIAQNLRCETRAHCLTVCASTHRVFLYICFRYAFIYTVWNAVLLDARNSRTDRLSHGFVFVCPEARLRLRLNALAFSNTFIRN